MKKTTFHSGSESRRGSTWGSILWVFLLALSTARISFSQGRDQDVTLKIPPVRTALKVENQPVTITATGTITMTSRQQDRVAFRLDLVADLSDFQRTIQADGSLGELLRTGPFEQMLREKVGHALQCATEKGTNISETLPPAAQGFVTVLSARFKDGGSGHLAVVLGGETHITSAQAELLKNQLQERASRAR
jgi:hypothetical protein